MKRHDELTGMLNRTAFDELATKPNQFEWLIRVDLDTLIFVNDFHGHQMGDRAIARTGKVLQSWAETMSGAAYRVGGDDFILLLPKISAEYLNEALHALQDQLQLSEYTFGDHPLRPAEGLSASFLALGKSDGSRIPLNELQAQADELLLAERESSHAPISLINCLAPSKAKRSFIVVKGGYA